MLGQLIRQNLRRNRRHNLLSSIGIVVGIGAFTFFLALDAGVRKVVLGEIFPVDRMEVVPPKSTLFGGGGRLDEAMVRQLRSPPGDVGVTPLAVYPKMKLAFPARGWGGKGILPGRGRDFYFEVSGFLDGVEPGIMSGEVQAPFEFADFEASTKKPPACKAGSACDAGLYCAWDVYECHRPIPAVVSKHMIELYNGSIAPSIGLPRIPSFITSIFRGKTFTVEMGRSYFGTEAKQGGRPIHRQFQLVGISDKAIPLGLTIPLGYVQRLNQRYAGAHESKTYSSVVLVVRSKADITALAAYVKRLGLDLAESAGEKVGLFITLATALFAAISVIIIGIAAINIAHTFMMLIGERRREIGLLRAVGASRHHIRMVILGEAGVVGLVGGAVGVALAFAGARFVDWYSATRLPDFPFKPESYFSFTLPLCGVALGFAVLFCLLGALVPASRAARLEPAAALSTR